MGDGNRIVIIIGKQPPVTNQPAMPEMSVPENLPQTPQPGENGANLFNRQWNNSSASDLKAALFALLSGEPPSQQFGKSNNIPPGAPADYQPENNFQNDFDFQNGRANSPKQENLSKVANQTLNELLDSAQTHEDFAEFRNQPKTFWDNARRMSDVRIVEKYVDGNLEPRAVSRYGELLGKFTGQGGELKAFLDSLPPEEREVFRARYLLQQITGADELFIGRGAAIDKNGRFVVRDFLTNNGKQTEISLNTLLGLLGGKIPENSVVPLFAGGQILLNTKTAALLSLSLALYQNVNSKLPFEENLSEAFVQNLLDRTNENGKMRFLENNPDNSKINAERRHGEILIAAALINGALLTLEEIVKFAGETNRQARRETVCGSLFSAGATGAMLGATVGCIVPLAPTNVAAALGFAASVVVGTSERGLRYLSANLLISNVIASGIQTLLNAAGGAVLPPKSESPELLKRRLFNNRRLAYLAS